MVTKPVSDPRGLSLARFLRALPSPLRRHKLLTALCRLGIVAPHQPVWFDGGAKAWVDLRDAESRATLLSGTFWPEFHPMVAAFLREGGDLFDVGANLGLVTFGVLPVVREMGIGFHLFEANSRLIPLLRRSALEWPSEDVRVVHCCVTDAAGISYHRLPDACWGHGQIDTHGEAVTNLRLDDYVAVADVEAVGFLKLDVEGWELNALRGAESALASGKVKAGFVELVPEALARAGASVADVLTYLQGKGFDVYFAAMWEREDPHGLTWRTVGVNGTELRFAGAVPLPASFAQGDVLVIHRSSPIAAQVSAAF